MTAPQQPNAPAFFPARSELERADAYTDAKHEAARLTRETGTKHTFKWVDDGYQVQAIAADLRTA